VENTLFRGFAGGGVSPPQAATERRTRATIPERDVSIGGTISEHGDHDMAIRVVARVDLRDRPKIPAGM